MRRSGSGVRGSFRLLALWTALCAIGLWSPGAASAAGPPAVPSCFSTGSGYGLCQGEVIPGGGSITKLIAPENSKGEFTLHGPTPLQSTQPVACGDAGCVYNHLDWYIGSGVAVRKGCGTNESVCEVTVAERLPLWSVVYVRQNNDNPQLWAIWNSGHPARKVSGSVSARQCDTTCKRRPVAGARVTVRGPAGSGSATTSADGRYEVTVPQGKGYVVRVTYRNARFDPGQRTVDLSHGSAGGVDFQARAECESETADAERGQATAASDSNPCQRLYTFTLRAWVPYTTVADPFTGSTVYDGSNYPISAKSLASTLSLGVFGTDAYPPCLGAQVLKTFLDTRPDLDWRARFLGGGTQTFPSSGGLGSVTARIAWNSAANDGQGKLSLRPSTVDPGTLARQYDYTLDGHQGSCRQPVVRTVTPTVRVGALANDRFVIDVSWPIPFKPYEDLADLKDFNQATLGALTDPEKKKLELELEKLPGYKDAPAKVKGKVKEYAVKLAEMIGGTAAITAVKELLAKSGKYLTDWTPPPIKYGKKALEILRKASYGSADLRLIGTFHTTERIPGIIAGNTTLSVKSDSDSFPSFGLAVSSKDGPVPWTTSQSVTVRSDLPDQYAGLPNVVNDAPSECASQDKLQGGPGTALLLDCLKVLTNAIPELISPFAPPALIGDPGQTRTITWGFSGQNS